MTLERKNTGKAGEEAAARYLSGRGFKILSRNYVCPLGELDVIAQDGDVLVFVEVRARTGTVFGLPQESITTKKRRKLRQLAWYYLKATNQAAASCRFDAVAVLLDRNTGALRKIEHIPNAF